MRKNEEGLGKGAFQGWKREPSHVENVLFYCGRLCKLFPISELIFQKVATEIKVFVNFS